MLSAALFGAGLSSATIPGSAQAATIEEIVVTAQRREESLQEVPISVAAFSQDMLERSGISGTRELPALTPSLQLVSSGPSATFFVRGVGNTSSGTGEEGTNAFYVDGVFMPSLKQTFMKFNNIERVEVLKGPQGTLFGRNSSGGLVNVITKDPGDEFEAKVSVGAANYDTTKGQLYVAGPITETLSADLALTSTNQGKGWGENQATGKDVNLGWDWGARTKWVWTPNDEAKISFAAEYSKSSDDFGVAYRLEEDSLGVNPALMLAQAGTPEALAAFATIDPADYGPTLPLKDPYDTNTPEQQFSDIDTWGLNLTAEFDLGWATLTSITGSRKGTNHSYFDLDMTPYDLLNIRVEDSEISFQEELRLASNSDGPLNWQAGLFYLTIDADLDPQTFTGQLLHVGGGPGDYAVVSSLDTTSYAVFGEVSYDITDATTLTLGGRYTRDELDFKGEMNLLELGGFTAVSNRDSTTEEEPTYRVALRHQLTDDVSVYGSYNRGFKSGSYAMSDPTRPPVKPQTIDAYELGVKTDLLDNRLRLNASVFHYEISDYQVRSASGPNPTPVLLNAAEVEVDGLEVEFEAAITDGLRLFGSLAWLDSEFSEFTDAPFTSLNTFDTGAPFGVLGGTRTVSGDATGNETPLAPEFSGNIGIAYNLALADAGEVDMSLLYSYNSGFYYEPDNRLEQPSYGLLNGSLRYSPAPSWSVELWGRNLTDETYYSQKLTVSSLGDVGITAAPRTFGINLEYTY
ncbi:TonB-dependent receptor [Pseudomaricurvus sp. HS19]|uniref:TonB-dependent receptor n=1 Tax=Pseudomaricurvus sp. HS19 TaxID=2692626 RepID=UPI001370C458|nr:TonB-dependent receptor [Pseudomaricurvus sp. HS19]MYM64013.1 TonB-dependent receptor [Pseudomaricurvus sp. HS19]